MQNQPKAEEKAVSKSGVSSKTANPTGGQAYSVTESTDVSQTAKSYGHRQLGQKNRKGKGQSGKQGKRTSDHHGWLSLSSGEEKRDAFEFERANPPPHYYERYQKLSALKEWSHLSAQSNLVLDNHGVRSDEKGESYTFRSCLIFSE